MLARRSLRNLTGFFYERPAIAVEARWHVPWMVGGVMVSPEKPQVTSSHGSRGSRRSSRRRTRGVVMVEYAFLLAFFGVPVMLATASAGIALINGYGNVPNDILGKGP